MIGIAYKTAQEMVFGNALHPVTTPSGIVIGGGAVIPEVNYTLPPMVINETTLPEVRLRYREMTRRILQRAVELRQEVLILEFEQLYELTQYPHWGAYVTSDIKEVMEEFTRTYGVKSALRVTIADIRDKERPPRMRSGEPMQTMLKAFDQCAAAGADILSIESTGGKELTDRALLDGDIEGLVYGLGVLAPNDMGYLWDHIVAIARKHGVIAGGDTACGFANTAMQLAHQRMLPKVLAAIVRLMAAPRSLVAIERGATGPLKDCAYENPILKAITGVPISMEGKTSACAHSSPYGNLTAAVCDLWSNESVQDVKLLSGYTPEVFTEMLIYDCRLMNTALRQNAGQMLRDLLVQSDHRTDIQSLVMDLDVCFETARRIKEAGTDSYARTLAATRWALEVLLQAQQNNVTEFSRSETRWLNHLSNAIQSLPETPDELRHRLKTEYNSLFIPAEYELWI
ncbi:MAG: methyltransferase MtaB domain-containing protein [Anaerolineales bacterium]